MESLWNIGHSKKQLSRWRSSPSLINCSLIVQLRKSSCWEERPTSLFYRRKRKEIMPSFKMLSSRWICLRRKLVSIRLCQGEKQRVLLARALAQEPTLLLLDEPTNHLDIKYQLDLLAIVKNLKVNVLAVLHDIQLACRYSDYLYLMKEGEILYQGTPKETITLSHCKLYMEFKVR